MAVAYVAELQQFDHERIPPECRLLTYQLMWGPDLQAHGRVPGRALATYPVDVKKCRIPRPDALTYDLP